MKKRILSLLLALCLLVGLMPAAVFAAEPEEALYAQMLELGLVDADGALIEDNTFTVEDGTRLLSLDELIEWLNQCDESDLDKIITVDSTGKSATVEQIMYALIIEYQIADVAGQLNTLASGTYAVSSAAVNSAVPTYVHDMRLGMVISRNDNILTLEVCLVDKKLDGTTYKAPYDITVEVGMFADFLATFSEDYAADENSIVPCTNNFRTYTIPAGSSSIVFKMDLNKLRTNYLSKYNGLWDGNAYMLFQARTVAYNANMPDSTIAYCVSIAPSSETDPVVNAITGGTSIGMNDADKGEVVPYRLSWSGNGTTTTVNGEECFAFTVDNPAAKGDYSSYYYGWKNYFGRALQAGVGDPNDPKVNLANVTIWTEKKLSNNKVLRPYFYAEIENDDSPPADNEFVKITDLAFYYQETSEEDFKNSNTAAGRTLLELTRVHLDHWYDDTSYDSKVTSDTLFKDISKHNKQLTNFYNVQVPVYSPNPDVVRFPHNWYLNVNWIEKNDDKNLQPNEILMYGPLTIVDKTAPTIKSIDTCARKPVYEGSSSYYYSYFYPGDYIPIVVTFSEPVYGEYQLVYLDGTEKKYLSSNSGVPSFEGDVTRNGTALSNTRVFYYYVNRTDTTGLQVLGVKPVGTNCTDVYGNKFEANTDVGYKPFGDSGVLLLDGQIIGGELKYSILSMTATPDDQDPNEITFKVNLYNLTQFKQDWKTWSDNGSDDPVISVRVDLGNDGVKTVDLTLAKDGTGINEVYNLTGTMSLPVSWSETVRVAELYYDDSPLYGVYATFTQKEFVFASMGAFTIGIDGEWPSGIDNTIFKQDLLIPTLSVTDNNTEYTYKYLGYEDIYWKIVSGSDVVNLVVDGKAIDAENKLTLAVATKVSIMPVKEGTAIIALYCGNNGKTDSQASQWLTVTVKDNGRPTLLFPKGADSVYAQVDMNLTVPFVSTLAQHAQADGTDGKITAQLYSVDSVDENGELILSATSSWKEELDRNATSLTIPAKYLTEISKGDTPSYILRLTATAQVDSTVVNFSTDAKIFVRAQPAVIKLTGLINPMFTDDQTIEIGWTIENFDLDVNPDDCQFQFTVEKDGNPIYSYSFDENNEKSNTGSYTLKPDTPEGLRDYYIVTAKAKNGTDPKWSIASSTIIVYRTGALDIQIGGKTVDSLTLKNEITGGTTTDPSVTTYSGEIIGGLTTAQAIAKLRSELSLMESIGINFNAYDWDSFLDCIKWSTSTGRGEEITDEMQRAVTINYRSGTLYSPIENFSYTSYIPEVIFILSGIRDGSNTITAQHNSIPALSDSVTVNVETLENKLYLFQFTPAARTEISYEDGLGETHTLYTNNDGSLALFEPNGIASDLRAASVSGGVSYRGTVSQLLLKSGEGNATRGELYPLNTAELRRAATAQVQLLQPDGKPLANTNVTLRGGVYRNRYFADYRDDAYCADAKFAKEAGQTASLDGTQDQTFTTDANGMLTVHMDLSQFTSANNTYDVGVGDSLEFIFELRFDGSYYPEIVIVDGSLTQRDAMRSGEYIVTLTAANKAKPFVAVQTISYTSREIDVRRHTGVVGPSSNYPSAVLDSTVMLWGLTDASLTDTGYSFDLRSQENGVSVPRQKRMTANDASYPFSSIPLLNNVVTIDSSSFANYDGTRKTPLEAAIYNGNGGLVCTVAMPFGIADLTTIDKIEESTSVINLMKNIALYGTVGGKNYGYGKDANDGLMSKALSFLEEMGGKIGLVRAILMPTADPTRYQAYLWTGIDTTTLRDLDYDRNGLYVEPHYVGESYESLLGDIRGDAFYGADFQAMADGSYFDDFDNRNKTLNGILKTFVIPDMIKMEGWMSAEICYNFDKGQWQIITTGGGFTAGGQLEFALNLNLKPKGIPITMGFTVRGGAVVDFKTAVRYAEQLGLEWNDDTADKVNDYLTSLRINAYFELFCGLGYDKAFVANYSIYGLIDINNENRFLTRNYLKNPEDRGMEGQFVQVDGEVGIRLALGVGPAVVEFNLVSLNYGNAWRYNEWDDINDYWKEASSGLGSAWLSDITSGQSLLFSNNSRNAILASAPVVKLQSRDYLEEGERIWLGGDNGIALMSLDNPNKLNAIETNSYPFSTPMISDDGSILVYLSDADSSDVTDVEVRYSRSNGGSFPEGEAIPAGADGFSGYGDSSLDFDGTSEFAGAVWLREAATTGLKAEAELDESQQRALLNGLEVVASIWDGSKWTTTRLTDNGSQEFNPVIAVNNGKAIAVWRSVQTDENIFTFSQNRILCKIYDNGKWSDEAYTLYNGSAGNVTGISAEMLADGTAAVAFSVDDESGSSEIYYTVVDTKAESPEDNAKTIRATTNTYNDENPQLTTVGEQFVLGWASVQSMTGVEQNDVSLRVFDKNGAPQPVLPESLSEMVSTASFDGQFTFVKGADSLEKLSLIWNDAKAGGEDNDVIRAIKFVEYDNKYVSSAAIEVAVLPERTGLNNMDACVTNKEGTGIQAVMQCTTYSDTEFDEVDYSYELDDKIYTGSGLYPKETVNLLSASATYTNALEVVATTVDYTTLAADSYVPINFTIANMGMNVINSVTIELDDAETQTFTGLTLLPGQSKTFSAVTMTGAVIEDLNYTVTAEFAGATPCSVDGTVYLDYPDVGISALTVTKEQDGERTVLANLYNQSAASLNRNDRRVVLGVYSDPECETPIDGKYFGGSANSDYKLTLTGDKLAAIDSTGYTQEITFNIDKYVKDAKLEEIPESGVMLFVKAYIEQQVNGEWIVLPEVDDNNNQKHITFESMLTRSGNVPITISVEIDNGSFATTYAQMRSSSLTRAAAGTAAYVQVRNNSLQPRTTRNNTNLKLVAALLDGYGNLLETKNVDDLDLGPEEVVEFPIEFSKSGARVVLRYGEPASEGSESNANAANITIDGLPLTIDSFNKYDSATLENVSSGQYLLTVIPEGKGATVTVNGKPAENGMMSISGGDYKRTVSIAITSADGSTTRTYTIYLNPDPSQITYPVFFCILNFDTNGGSDISSLIKSFGTTVDLTAYTPTRSGYIFTGWYADEALTEKVTNVKLTDNRTIYAGWQEEYTGGQEETAESPFTDVPEGSYYEEAVNWAVKNRITSGTTDTTFSPDATCTRAQAVTFLWRAAGCPIPESNDMPFQDVVEGSYYETAVLWAVENGITLGTSDTTFSPDAYCTRAQIVTFLWRAQKSPAAGTLNPFTDVAADAYYADAVLWAVENGITNGTSDTTFSPDADCIRAQIVTFIWRTLAE